MIWLLLACAPGAARSCEDLCRTLVQECGYEAYPSFQSCQEGCAYAIEQGADVEAEKACIEAASCDVFRVLECEHDHGF